MMRVELRGPGETGRAKEGKAIELTPRQLDIMQLVKINAPITGEQIAEQLGLSRPTIRSDLAVLVMLGCLEAKPKVGYFLGKTAASGDAVANRLAAMTVKDVKSVPVIVRETTSVHDAVVTLFLENVGSLIVADGDNLLQGVVSRRDLLKATLGNANPGATPVGIVMTRLPNVVTVTPEESLIEAGRKMIRHEVDSLPVVQPAAADERKAPEVVGRISKTTLLEALLGAAAEEAW